MINEANMKLQKMGKLGLQVGSSVVWDRKAHTLEAGGSCLADDKAMVVVVEVMATKANPFFTVRDVKTTKTFGLHVNALVGQVHHDEEFDAGKLARAFVGELRKDIGVSKIKQAAIRNSKDDNPSVCHTHDFCDANMSMHAAGIRLGYWTDDSDLESLCPLMNKAWDIAKAASFKLKAL